MTTASQLARPHASVGEFQHVGLLYRHLPGYLDATTAFVREALEADRPVLVAVPTSRLGPLAGRLGPAATAVETLDMSEAGRNPGRIIPGVLIEFASRHPGRRVAIISEPIWPGRSEIEYPACAVHEALINPAFAGRDAEIWCPYHTGGLSDAAIADAHRTHPVMIDEHGQQRASTRYTDPLRTAAGFHAPLPPPPPTAALMSYRDSMKLGAVRGFVTGYAAAEGVPQDRAGQLVLAINELAMNSLQHASGGGQIRIWREPSALVCQVDDGGHLTDLMAGLVPPPPYELGGRGLLMVNELCDLVRLYSRPGHTSARIYTYL